MDRKCTLPNPACGSTRCGGCGWEETERQRRGQLLRKKGLTRCSDGLYALVIGETKQQEGAENAGRNAD